MLLPFSINPSLARPLATVITTDMLVTVFLVTVHRSVPTLVCLLMEWSGRTSAKAQRPDLPHRCRGDNRREVEARRRTGFFAPLATCRGYGLQAPDRRQTRFRRPTKPFQTALPSKIRDVNLRHPSDQAADNSIRGPGPDFSPYTISSYLRHLFLPTTRWREICLEIAVGLRTRHRLAGFELAPSGLHHRSE